MSSIDKESITNMKIRLVYSISNVIIVRITSNQIYEMMRRTQEIYMGESGLLSASMKQEVTKIVRIQY